MPLCYELISKWVLWIFAINTPKIKLIEFDIKCSCSTIVAIDKVTDMDFVIFRWTFLLLSDNQLDDDKITYNIRNEW